MDIDVSSSNRSTVKLEDALQSIPLLQATVEMQFPMSLSFKLGQLAKYAEKLQNQVSEANNKFVSAHAQQDESGEPLYSTDMTAAFRSIYDEEKHEGLDFQNQEDIIAFLKEQDVPEEVPQGHKWASDTPAFTSAEKRLEYYEEIEKCLEIDITDQLPTELSEDEFEAVTDIFDKSGFTPSPQQAQSFVAFTTANSL